MWGAYAATRLFRQVSTYGTIQLFARQRRSASKVLGPGSIFSLCAQDLVRNPTRVNVCVQGEEFDCLVSEIAAQSYSLPTEAISFAVFARTEGRDPERGEPLRPAGSKNVLSRADAEVISQFLENCRSDK